MNGLHSEKLHDFSDSHMLLLRETFRRIRFSSIFILLHFQYYSFIVVEWSSCERRRKADNAENGVELYL
jgi:hypothetical protein